MPCYGWKYETYIKYHQRKYGRNYSYYIVNPCECGCGGLVYPNKWRNDCLNRNIPISYYINGHNMKGVKQDPEWIEKRTKNSDRRYTQTEQWKEDRRNDALKNWSDPEFVESWKETRWSDENRQIARDNMLGELNWMFGRNGELNPFYGKHHTSEVIEYLRKIAIGRPGYWKGKHLPEQVRARISKKVIAKWKNGDYDNMHINRRSYKGEGNPNWRGGNLDAYCAIFSDLVFREYIKERDSYCCPCGVTRFLSFKVFCEDMSIHHIDYDRQNCVRENLITTCRSCNAVANGNREYWTEYYRGILTSRYGYTY